MYEYEYLKRQHPLSGKKKADGKQSQKLEHKAFANTEHILLG